MVEQIKVAMPPAMSRWAFRLDPFHSWKIQPQTVAKIMMLDGFAPGLFSF